MKREHGKKVRKLKSKKRSLRNRKVKEEIIRSTAEERRNRKKIRRNPFILTRACCETTELCRTEDL